MRKWIKGSLSQLMDKYPNLKFTFASVMKQVFVQNYWYENMCYLYVHSHENQVIFMWNVLHKHSFWERSKRHLRSGSKASSMCVCQAVHQARAYSSFCSMKRLEVFLLPPGLDASPSQGYPQPVSRRYPFIHLGGERHRESKVFCPRTQHNVPGQGSNPDRSLRSRAR